MLIGKNLNSFLNSCLCLYFYSIELLYSHKEFTIIMKKALVFILSLMISISLLAATPAITIKDGNIYNNIDIIKKDGTRLTEETWNAESGDMIHTNKQEITLISSFGEIHLEPNSFLELTNIDTNPQLYLIFGEVSINLYENLIGAIKVKTPTTVAYISGKGESIIISEDDEETFLNYSEKDALVKNTITGKSVTVKAMTSFNGLKNSFPLKNVSRKEYAETSFLLELPFLPDAPNLVKDSSLLVGINDAYAIPTVPSISKESTMNLPITRSFAVNEESFKLVATDKNIEIYYPESYTMADVLALLSSVVKQNPLVNETNPIYLEYRNNMSYADLEALLIKLEQTLISNINKNKFLSLEKEIETDVGTLLLNVSEGSGTISLPEDMDIDTGLLLESLLNLENEKIHSFTTLERTIFFNYSEDSTNEEFSLLENAVVDALKKSEESGKIKSSVVTSNESQRKFSFDLKLATRAFTDSSALQSLETSIMPEFTYGAFRLALNLNPFEIMDYKDNKDALDWTGYALSFIDALQYRSMNEVFSLTVDKSTALEGDSLSLYSGYDHLLDRTYRPLTFNMDISSKHFDLRVFFNDLTMGRFANGEIYSDRSIGGVNLKYIVNATYPFSIELGLLTDFAPKNIKDTQMYTEASVYIPFYSKGFNEIGLKFGFASKLDLLSKTYNPADAGMLLSASLPMKFSGFKADFGVHYTNYGEKTTNGPLLHYKGLGNVNFTPIFADTNLITLSTMIGYENPYFGINLSMFGDVRTDSMNFMKENTFLDVSTYLSFSGITLRGGLMMQDFTSGDKYKEDATIYAGLDIDAGGVSTYFRTGIDSIEDKDYFLTYGATASFMGRNSDRKDNPVKIPLSFEIKTGYKYEFENKRSKYIVQPAMTVGEGNYLLSLRAPLEFAFDNEGSFGLVGAGGREWWNFGSSETGAKRIFYALTDSLRLINYITIADPEESIAYINASRDYLRNDTLFTAFGTDDALSLRTGFNFYNLSLEVYGGDVESPHIGAFKIGIYPIDLDGFSIDLSLPSEYYFKDKKNFNLFFYPEVKLNIPLFWNHFNIALYAVGSVSTEYVDGQPTNTKVIYDFGDMKFYSALAGVEMGLKWPTFSISLDGGWRTGALRPDMYNVFTSTYNETPSLYTAEDSSSFFGKATVSFNFKPFQLELAYSINDFKALIDDYRRVDDDIFSVKTRISFNDSISMYGTFNRKGFISLFQKGVSFVDDIFKSANTIYSLGMDFDYGIVSINAEYSSSLFSSGFVESNFINVNPNYTSMEITSSFSITTRIKF